MKNCQTRDSRNKINLISIRLIALRGGGEGTPIHYLYGYVPPTGVVILKLLIQNGVSISETFSRTGYNISNARKLQFCKQPFEIIQGQIAFKNTVQCVNNQTIVLLLHPVFQHAGRAYFGASRKKQAPGEKNLLTTRGGCRMQARGKTLKKPPPLLPLLRRLRFQLKGMFLMQ